MRFWSLFLLLTLAFMIPVGALLWMAERAAQAEPLALKELLRESLTEDLVQLESRIRQASEGWAMPKNVFELQESPYDALYSLREGGFPLLNNEGKFPTTSQKAEELIRRIRAGEEEKVAELSGLYNGDIMRLIYSDTGRNINLDAWRFLYEKNSKRWGRKIQERLKTFPLICADAEQLRKTLLTLKMDARKIVNSIHLRERFQGGTLDSAYNEHQNLYFRTSPETLVSFPEDELFIRNGITIAPGITVKSGQVYKDAEHVHHTFTLLEQEVTLIQALPDNAPLADRRRKFFTAITILSAVFSVGVSWFVARKISAEQRLTDLKNTFLATATHELKTPLAATSALLETLEKGVLSAREEKEYLSLLSQENQRLGQLVDQFLTYSRTEEGRLRQERISLADLLSPVEKWLTLRPELREEEYEVSFPARGEIIGEEVSLQTALINLLDNAVKFSAPPRNIKLGVTVESSQVTFSVSNTGPEIPSRKLKEIFKPFYQIDQRLSRAHEGVGLGLSIVRSVTQAHGGEVNVLRKEGETVFQITLPHVPQVQNFMEIE